MRYCILFLFMTGFCVYEILVVPVLWARILLGNAGLAFLGTALGYGFLGPRVFLKNPKTGKVSFLSTLIYWPYQIFSIISLLNYRLTSGEPYCDQILPGLILGGRLWPHHRSQMEALEVKGVIDLTSEFSEVAFLRNLPGYKGILLLDGTAPTLEELKDGVEWMERQMESGSVYVHCAMGHSRSTTFVVAFLLAQGQAGSVDDALAFVASIRPKVHLSWDQRKVLEEYWKERQSP